VHGHFCLHSADPGSRIHINHNYNYLNNYNNYNSYYYYYYYFEFLSD